ncbi:MAG: hypothetical protein IJA14_04655 [Alphaproteobacteria bacterium]|nr:hypothetical protein [Alphaproteobacteria bacterium]
MEKIIFNNRIYSQYDFSLEKDLENKVVEYSKAIFGKDTIYFDTKRRISKGDVIAIPDGYLIDFTFENDPRLYIIENELISHDVYKHIGEQILKFGVSYKASGHKLKDIFLDYIEGNNEYKTFINEKLKKSNYRNIDAFLEDIIFHKKVGCIVVIDEESKDLENVLSQLTMETDIIVFQAYKNNLDYIYKFTPFQEEIRAIEESSPNVVVEELDTIVVPAREEGFNRVFLGENCWYEIKISSSMIPKIKYIAAYQTASVSAITYYAEVSNIEKYKDTNKYILYFKDKAIKLDSPIKIAINKGIAPQSPRYTTFNKIKKSKTLEEVFS